MGSQSGTVSSQPQDDTRNTLLRPSNTSSFPNLDRINNFIDFRRARKAQRDFKKQQEHTRGVTLVGFSISSLHLFEMSAFTATPSAKIRTEGSSESLACDGASSPTSVVTLHDISQHDKAMEQFVLYCIKSSFINELLFWMNIEYSIKCDPLSRAQQFRNVNILTKYLDANTEYHVQIPSKALPKNFFRQTDRKREISQDVLVSAHDYVEKYINEQVMPLFVRSRFADAIRGRPPFVKHSDPVHLHVNGFKKCYTPSGKYYTFEIECLIPKGGRKFQVFRRYEDFVENHRALCNKFPQQKFPALPPPPGRYLLFRRGATRRAARKQMKHLAAYLENLLEMPAPVVQSNQMREFLEEEEEGDGKGMNSPRHSCHVREEPRRMEGESPSLNPISNS